MSIKKIRIATRGSALSLIQTRIVTEKLAKIGIESEVVIVRPQGDRDKDSPLTAIGGNGLFVRGLEETILSGKADIAVHSAKDLPYELAEGLVIGSLPDAADPRDVLLTRAERNCSPVIGTDSPRRREDLRHLFPEAVFTSLRGNVPTRIEKLREGQYDAIVLAKAGLDRLVPDLTGLEQRVLNVREVTPAPCQGILAVECRRSDTELQQVLREITDPAAEVRFEIERYVFTRLRADCSVPIGVHAQITGEQAVIYVSFAEKKIIQKGSVRAYRELCDEIIDRLCPGSVMLVGAGPGAGTLTLDGLAAVQQAQVICYDDLIDKSILQYAPEGCEKIPVGKRGGRHMMKQEEIIRLLIDLARRGKKVVRLKGGDPFVFGRGSEEAAALKEQNIPFTLIPGVSSAISVPESFGIPVTHRGTSDSFTIVTGHGADDRSPDYERLAHTSGTLVILMGLHNLRELSGRLIRHGMDPDRPAAVLSCGFSPDARRYDGTVATIADMAQDAMAPAIIVIGEVAQMDLRSPQEGLFDQKENVRAGCLSGKKIEIVGTKPFIQKLGERIRSDGADVLETEALRVVQDPDALPADLSGYTWVVFTSPNGVRAMQYALQMRGTVLCSLEQIKTACVGPGTAETLKKFGLQADLVPRRHSAAGLAEELIERIAKEEEKNSLTEHRVLLIQGENAFPDLPDGLHTAGIAFDICILYRTENALDPDLIVFSSASAAAAYLESHRIKDKTVICMGKKTAEAAAAKGARIRVTEQSNLQELYKLIRASAQKEEEGE